MLDLNHRLLRLEERFRANNQATIGIQPDDYTTPAEQAKVDSSSERWANILSSCGFDIKWLDLFGPDPISQIRECDAILWRWAHWGRMHKVAKPLLTVAEIILKKPVFPNWNTCWHYDDKVSQAYIFEAARIPAPQTWVFFDKEMATNWAENMATFPLVFKLAAGASGSNVMMVSSRVEARRVIDEMFDYGMSTLTDYHRKSSPHSLPWRVAARHAARTLIRRALPPASRTRTRIDLEWGYILFQEFLAGNDFDTRVSVVGDRAFARRRFNRPGDFRASGSGEIDWNPATVDTRFIDLAFRVADTIGATTCAIDGMYKNDIPVITEISYNYAMHNAYKCPGHWRRGGPDGKLSWVEGNMWPEEAQVEMFLANLHPKLVTIIDPMHKAAGR